MDPIQLYRAELAALVGGGEQVLAVAHCQQAYGSERLERSPEEMERLVGYLPGRLRESALAALRAEPRPERAWERVVAVLVGADSVIRFDVEQALGGVAAAGHVGSCAARLAEPLRDASMAHCVVTDRRLILATMDIDPVAFRLRAVLPVGAVLRAQRAGKFLQRGRVVIDFVDLSQLALMTGVFGTERAEAIVGALAGHTKPAAGR
ncbi:hypothetical protein KZZ52_42030 [Dactylosporangium sp. AC04546]|uniref:hypothetical protein n=1 Tax=Dactylosporangium sp. AC04546 TaxID=2862460 RepID=UPI001EDFC372|nr:hypothetical protein [Dactylosporangium sp. AC04546]WVK80505.1 hypothetical protein KZZ52_42030 [Dactylosporangium sp. AC04546]